MPPETRPLPPCRLHVILASAAPRAVILRRGPSNWTQVILWQTNTDTFEYGQWFHGSFYPEVCDLSPDGTLFLYFVSKYQIEGKADPAYTHKWTAISKPPYFTALALWPAGDVFRMKLGGGVFLDARTVWLWHHDMVPHPDHLPLGLTIVPHSDLADLPEPHQAPQGRGWRVRDPGHWPERGAKWTADTRMIREKRQPRAPCSLIESIHDRWGHVRRYHLLDRAQDVLVPLDATWADLDQHGRLVFARAGKVFAGTLQDAAIHETLLADFNPQQFTEVIAPDWATHW